jgi:hypothetical protein
VRVPGETGAGHRRLSAETGMRSPARPSCNIGVSAPKSIAPESATPAVGPRNVPSSIDKRLARGS